MCKVCLIALIILVISFSGAPEARRPFCGFSLNTGFYYQEEGHSYITREAQPGDESGIPDVGRNSLNETIKYGCHST